MNRRTRRRADREFLSVGPEPNTDEVMRLQRKVARLERALERALDTTRSALNEGRLGERPSGFAAAWSQSDSQPEMAEDFFSAGHPDMRARSWLLATT